MRRQGQVRCARARGIYSLEASIGLVLVAVAFLFVLDRGQLIWSQMQTEQRAADLARSVARMPVVAGATAVQDLAGGVVARISWTDELVFVEVEDRNGRTPIHATSAYPREVP